MACDAPISIRYNPPLDDGKGGRIYSFPADCGKCIKCLTKRKAQWSFRLTEEKRKSFSAYFVTLTYEDKYLVYGDNGPTVNKNDHFEFIKKLKGNEKCNKERDYISQEELDRKVRGIQETGKLSYYGISEYGDRMGRPHWHYLLFNVRDIANITNAWPYGLIQIDGDVNVNNIDYVLKYMIKHESDKKPEREKELCFMSKGLGLSALNDEQIRYIQAPDANMLINSRGKRIALPRYYRKKYCSGEVRSSKGAYIAQAVQQKEDEVDTRLIKAGRNPDKLKAIAKDQRNKQLINRKPRIGI